MAKGGGIITRVRRSLADMLRPPEDAAEVPRRRSNFWQLADNDHFIPENEFARKLQAIMAKSGSALAGRVNLIGLGKLKERLGTAAWERVADRADRIARNAIERRLLPGDIYQPWHAGTYVIVFATLGREQAQAKCALIADDIAKALLGEEGTNYLEVKTAVMQVDGSLDFVDTPAIEHLLSPPEVEDPPPAPAASDTPPSGLQLGKLANTRFAYRPMWDPSRSVISAYICQPVVPSPAGGDPIPAEMVIAGDPDARILLDWLVLARCKHDLKEMVAKQRRLLLVLSVHFDTLASASRRRHYITELEDLSPEERKLLLIEVVGAPQGVLHARLIELVLPLKPHCRAVMLQLRIETLDFAQTRGCGVLAVGADLTGHPGPELTIMQQMGRFQRGAEKAELVAYAHGVRSVSLAAAALGAGYFSIDGDAISKLIDRPEGILEFKLLDIYRPMVE